METKRVKNVSVVFVLTIFAPPNMPDKRKYSKKEEEIMEAATAIFMTYGIRSVTMDEVAQRMHISKKTLYRYVKNKNELVERCVAWDGRRMRDQMSDVQHRGLNAIEENLAYSRVVINEIKDIHPSIFFDLEKYYPEAYLVLDHLRYDFVSELVDANLKKGIRDGWYREDINVPIMTRMWVLRLNLIFTPDALSYGEFSVADVYREMVIHHLRGIASEKGLEYLQVHDKDLGGMTNSRSEEKVDNREESSSTDIRTADQKDSKNPESDKFTPEKHRKTSDSGDKPNHPL